MCPFPLPVPRARRAVVALTAALVVTALPAGPVAAEAAVRYQPPAAVAVADPFRAPSGPYGAGNRGVDLATVAGDAVVAAAPGEVTFAGPVGGSVHVVVLHADGIRTSYSFLDRAEVRRGDHVAGGDRLGIAAGGVHWGARLGVAYVDPLQLLAGTGVVRLAPDDPSLRPGSVASERRGLLDSLRGALGAAAGAGASGARWVGRTARGVIADGWRELNESELATRIKACMDLAHTLQIEGPTRLFEALTRWAFDDCTPGDVEPAPPTRRRRALLVAGLASSSDRGAAYAIDTDGLGYARSDVEHFSYTARGVPYEAVDSQQDINRSADRLIEQLQLMQRDAPGVPVDLLAHSQGGLVVRAALARMTASPVAGLPPIDTAVTLGSPHRGANLASAAARIRTAGSGRALLDGAGTLGIGGIDPQSPSVRQMAEDSDFLRGLAAAGWPDSVRLLSVGARWDLIVPSSATHVEGADNVVVSVPEGGPLEDHSALPSSAAATREIALAVAKMPPTCESLLGTVLDAHIGNSVSILEDVLGWAAAVGVHRIDDRVERGVIADPRRAPTHLPDRARRAA